MRVRAVLLIGGALLIAVIVGFFVDHALLPDLPDCRTEPTVNAFEACVRRAQRVEKADLAWLDRRWWWASAAGGVIVATALTSIAVGVASTRAAVRGHS